MNFSRGHSGTKVRNVNRACFPKEKDQNSQKWAKFMNFSFSPFLWFGLSGRLLNSNTTKVKNDKSGEDTRAQSPLDAKPHMITLELSGPNRAMQPRCAMRFESHTPKSLAMRKSFFASDAKTHSLDLQPQRNARKEACENSAMLACDAKNRGVF